MEQQAKTGEVSAAWRALDSKSENVAGWKTILIGANGQRRIRAGRHLPGNEEALLIGFHGMQIPKTEHLPNGRGFLVTEADLGSESGGLCWVALCRQESGSRELFGVMAEDLTAMLAVHPSDHEPTLFQAFLARIRAWQDFMLRGTDDVLGPERELGLLGELNLLEAMIAGGVSRFLAVESWKGPEDGLQDFLIGAGGIEVKSTASTSTFPARIGSLDQLNDELVKPLFLAGIRFSVSYDGLRLPEAIDLIRNRLEEDPIARRRFDTRLLHAGYLDSTASRYSRRFRHLETRLLEISQGFPRLIRSNVDPGITKAQYEVDLDSIGWPRAGLNEALEALGAITK